MPGLKKSLLLLGSVAILGCVAEESSKSKSGGAAPAAQQQATESASSRQEVLAPIESVEVLTRESAPPQYALRIVSGLPGGCAQFSRIEVTRQSDVIDVTVWNTVPADESVVCTMIYGTTQNTANLGADFESGKAYRVNVNSEPKTTFTAQ